MSSLQHIHTLMKAIGSELSLNEVIESREQPIWLLIFGPEEIEIAVELDEEDLRLTFYSIIGRLPEQDDVELYKLMLSYNGLWGETGGVRIGNRDSDSYLIYDTSAVNLDLSQLSIIVTNFAEKVEHWRGLFEKRLDPSSSVVKVGDDTHDSNFIEHSIRV